MKRLLALIALSAVLLAGCGKSDDSDNGVKPSQTAKQGGSAKTTEAAAADSPADTTDGTAASAEDTAAGSQQAPAAEGGILVAYFTPAENGENDAVSSASKVNFWGEEMGNAEAMANVIAAYTGGDLFSIQTVKDYPLDYNALVDDAKAEQTAGELPELATAVDVSGYSTVFVVYPVWWYTMPQPIYSFFNEYDLSDKTIIPVTTHGGSGLADSVERIKELEPSATVKDGFDVRDSDIGSCQEELESWLKDSGF